MKNGEKIQALEVASAGAWVVAEKLEDLRHRAFIVPAEDVEEALAEVREIEYLLHGITTRGE